MKALKKWLRDWLRDEEWVASMVREREQTAELAEILRAGMRREAIEVLRSAAEAKQTMRQRTPKPMWRKFEPEALGHDYGRIASAASTAGYPACPIKITIGTTTLALPRALVMPHHERGFVAVRHIPLHPHNKLPAFDFGDTEEQAKFNLSQQLAQIALHEGWALTLPGQQ